jgi:hypothetical protein
MVIIITITMVINFSASIKKTKSATCGGKQYYSYRMNVPVSVATKLDITKPISVLFGDELDVNLDELREALDKIPRNRSSGYIKIADSKLADLGYYD